MRTTPTSLGQRTPGELASDPGLLEQGWVRRFVAGPERLEEAVQLYQSMNHEVRLQRLTPESFGEACSHCSSTVCPDYVLIYTRPREDHEA